MIRLRRPSGIAAMSLLASAATASGECAWVLWTQSWWASEQPGSQSPSHVGDVFFFTYSRGLRSRADHISQTVRATR